jgi:hypothetical protein
MADAVDLLSFLYTMVSEISNGFGHVQRYQLTEAKQNQNIDELQSPAPGEFHSAH